MASQYVGIDLHRRRSVIVRQTPTGEVVDTVRIDNDSVALSCAVAEAGPDPEVEATPYGWVGHITRSRRVRREALRLLGRSPLPPLLPPTSMGGRRHQRKGGGANDAAED